MPTPRAAFVLLSLLGAALAGCVQQDDVAPAATVEPAAAVDVFHPALARGASELVEPTVLASVLVGDDGPAEPNMAVGYDGTLYIANPNAVWRSADNGATWTLGKGENLEGGGDADIALDANDTLYYLGLSGKEGRRIPFLASADKGETWTPAIDASAGSGADREWLDVTPDGRIYGTWRGDLGIEFNMSADGGATWLPKVLKVGPDGDGGPIVHDPVTGALVVPVVDMAGPGSVAFEATVHVHVSTDEGQTWEDRPSATLTRSPVEPNGYLSDFPVVAFDGAGTMYLVYSADLVAPSGGMVLPEEVSLYGIFLQVSHDLGLTWTEPLLISDPSKDARFPWIAAGAPGRIAAAWYENVNGIPGEMLPDEWNVMLYESITADQETIEGIVVKLTAEPNHLGQLCTSGTGCAVSDRSLLDFFELAIGLDGQPKVAFAASKLGIGFTGIAVEPTTIHFVTVEGTSLL